MFYNQVVIDRKSSSSSKRTRLQSLKTSTFDSHIFLKTNESLAIPTHNYPLYRHYCSRTESSCDNLNLFDLKKNRLNSLKPIYNFSSKEQWTRTDLINTKLSKTKNTSGQFHLEVNCKGIRDFEPLASRYKLADSKMATHVLFPNKLSKRIIYPTNMNTFLLSRKDPQGPLKLGYSTVSRYSPAPSVKEQQAKINNLLKSIKIKNLTLELL